MTRTVTQEEFQPEVRVLRFDELTPDDGKITSILANKARSKEELEALEKKVSGMDQNLTRILEILHLQNSRIRHESEGNHVHDPVMEKAPMCKYVCETHTNNQKSKKNLILYRWEQSRKEKG